jgi:hypothetical protein
MAGNLVTAPACHRAGCGLRDRQLITSIAASSRSVWPTYRMTAVQRGI